MKRPKDPTADKPIEVLYRQLVFDGIVTKVDKHRLPDYVGSFNYLGECHVAKQPSESNTPSKRRSHRPEKAR